MIVKHDKTYSRNDTNDIRSSNVPDPNSDGSDILVGEETDHMLVTMTKKMKMMQILM
jgi:hypothetical protein